MCVCVCNVCVCVTCVGLSMCAYAMPCSEAEIRIRNCTAVIVSFSLKLLVHFTFILVNQICLTVDLLTNCYSMLCIYG